MAKEKITKEFLVSELEKYISEHGSVPTRREFGLRSPVISHYGSYNKFLESNGYLTNKSGPPGKSSEELSEELHEFVEKNGRLPTRREFKNTNQIKQQYGTYNKFIAANGYEPNLPANEAPSLIGKRFGRLKVVGQGDKDKYNNTRWHCLCDCGNMKYDVSRASLTKGSTTSCGCRWKETFENIKEIDKYRVEDTFLLQLSDKLFSNNKTGVRGVHFDSNHQRYIAKIEFQKKVYGLGYHKRLEDAARARKEAESLLFRPILEKYEYLLNDKESVKTMEELEDLGKKKTKYMEEFLAKGFRVPDLAKDPTFLRFMETENKLIAERNKRIAEMNEKDSPHSD